MAARARKWCNHKESLRRTPRHDVRIIPAVATHTYTYTAHYTKEQRRPLIIVWRGNRGGLSRSLPVYCRKYRGVPVKQLR